MDQLQYLREVFPNKSEQVIVSIINLVEEGNAEDEDVKFEMIINLLTETGDSTLINNEIIPDDDSDEEGAVGYSNVHLTKELLFLFPDIDKNYLNQKLQQEMAGYTMDQCIDTFTKDGYVRFQEDPINILDHLKGVLPNADPQYLRKQAEIFVNKTQQELEDFIEESLEKHDYPSKEEYYKRCKENKLLALYKENFSVEQYLELIPNPVETFTNPERTLSLIGENVSESDIDYTKVFLYNRYLFIKKTYIDQILRKNKNLIQVCYRLDKLPKSFRRPRPKISFQTETRNIELLQVIAYITHMKEIKATIKLKNEEYCRAKEEARKYNLLETCQICYEDELIPEECYFCNKQCVFCKSCVKTGNEIEIGNGNLKFPCLICDSEFNLRTLQMVLDKNVFAKIEQKLQMEEIRQANLEGTETCPFCDALMILNETDKIIKCTNFDCLKESCRECRHESHVPLRCNEIEYDEDVRRRTYIENKMTEALIRTCRRCQKVFVKESGCNKMTCACGEKMCYHCGESILDYSHFGELPKCPLHSDLRELHITRVRQGAQQAVQELGNVEVKFDPTVNLETFFN